MMASKLSGEEERKSLDRQEGNKRVKASFSQGSHWSSDYNHNVWIAIEDMQGCVGKTPQFVLIVRRKVTTRKHAKNQSLTRSKRI